MEGSRSREEVNMSRSSRLGITAVFLAGFAALATLFLVGHIEGAKPASEMSLQASFEELWDMDENQNPVNLYRIQNDVTGLPYVDTPDVKVGKKIVKSGVEIKYYFPSGYYKQGKFTMTIDQSGSLQRFVRLHFLEPSTDPAYENESHFPGLHVDPLYGNTGTLLTSKISFTSFCPLKADENGILRLDPDTSLNMDKMQAGDFKYIALRIEFNPVGEFIGRTYFLGDLAYVSVAYGAAGLYCVKAGQEWEIRPFTETFTNEPDNSWRLLYTDVQIDFLRTIKLRSWHVPFVLRVTK
jgi:hypothetical protein